MLLTMPVPREITERMATAIRHALSASDMKLDTLASLMGITPPQLYQQLNGIGQFSLGRLLLTAMDRDGRVFWQYLLPEIAEMVGVEDSDAIARHLRHIVELFRLRQMAKASVHTEQERKRA